MGEAVSNVTDSRTDAQTTGAGFIGILLALPIAPGSYDLINVIAFEMLFICTANS